MNAACRCNDSGVVASVDGEAMDCQDCDAGSDAAYALPDRLRQAAELWMPGVDFGPDLLRDAADVLGGTQQRWVVLSNGFVYGPFESRQDAGSWCAKEHNAQVMPLNQPVDGV